MQPATRSVPCLQLLVGLTGKTYCLDVILV
jgi:hypothetical protein